MTEAVASCISLQRKLQCRSGYVKLPCSIPSVDTEARGVMGSQKKNQSAAEGSQDPRSAGGHGRWSAWPRMVKVARVGALRGW